MKRLFTLTAFLLAGLVSFSQYYYVTYSNPGQNPGGLNEDGEYPVGGGLPGDWTTVLSAQAGPLWSVQQSIPFGFDFNGVTVPDYYVSNSGVLTFNSSPGAAPGFTPSALPNAAIPDQSVCIWGIKGVSSPSDNVASKTFGVAPNRQHWILFSSFELGSGSWTYWSIVLEETTNKIYIVDQRQYQTSGSIYGGIQINSSTAIPITGLTPQAGNDPTSADNVYYAFTPGVQPNYELALTQITVNGSTTEAVRLNNNNTVGGTIMNLGANAITSFDVSYQVDGGSAQTYNVNGVNIAGGSAGTTYSFTHGIPWMPTTGGGSFSTLDVEISNINGGQTDPNPADNSLSADFFLSLGISATKYVLFEEYSTAPCGFCPDGFVVIEDMKASLSNMIVAQIHAGFGTDAMTIPEHSMWASDFTNAAPTAMTDRLFYEGEDYVAYSRSLWKQRTQDRLNDGAPVNIVLEGTYDNSTRELSLDVKAEFKDYAIPSEYRLNVYLTEDVVTGTGPGYDQINYYSSQRSNPAGGANHPFYNQPDPIPGYEHRDVIRSVPGSAWGNAGVIPPSPQPNQTYSKNYVIDIAPSWDDSEIQVVAFVSHYDADPKKRSVLNSGSSPLSAFGSVGIDHQPTVSAEIEVYPNPASDFAQVSLDLEKTSDVTVEVVNAVGQRHTAFAHSATYAAGKQYVTLPTYEWGAGVYMVNIRINGVNMVKQLVVTR